jgi:hypothetical protein
MHFSWQALFVALIFLFLGLIPPHEVKADQPGGSTSTLWSYNTYPWSDPVQTVKFKNLGPQNATFQDPSGPITEIYASVSDVPGAVFYFNVFGETYSLKIPPNHDLHLSFNIPWDISNVKISVQDIGRYSEIRIGYHLAEKPLTKDTNTSSISNNTSSKEESNDKNEKKSNFVVAPLKQFKSGIISHDVTCKEGFMLITKASDGSPACVKPETAQKLVEHGWGWAMQTIDSLKPLLPNRIIDLENDTGVVTFGNQTYYFETPHYTQDAYVNPMQISFHDVVFTLFPSGFKGGLPTSGGCGSGTVGEIVVGSGSYYWTDAKFSDGTHELLHIFADSKPCSVHSIPTYFSTHANPQAGLTFYDGKMKLLVSTNNPKLTYMNIKVYNSYTPFSLVDHFLAGSLYSTAGPIQNGNITIAVNGLVMGTTETYPSGCFQFNNWNDSKLADQINKSRSLGNTSTELNFQTQYFGDSNHNPTNASASSYLYLYAVPVAPMQYDTMLYPSDQINVTQGNSTQFHLTVKPFSKYWEVEHMKLNLQGTPCGFSYHISPVDNNNSVLVNNTASFDVVLNTTSYTPSGKYWIAIDQNMSGINEPNIGAEVGAFDLNVLKK